VLNVPRSVELLLSTVSASQDISGIDVRRLQADTVSGSLSAAGRSGDSKLNTVSGSVSARLQTPKLDVNTVSGRIEAGGGVSGDIGAQTVSGRVEVDAGRCSGWRWKPCRAASTWRPGWRRRPHQCRIGECVGQPAPAARCRRSCR
jgi:hypothetical protein